MLRSTGIAPLELVKERFPKKERYSKKAVAFIECYQDIPCNPCVTSCPHDAIVITGEITNQPMLNPELCTGCGICVYTCPGLAIMLVDQSKSDKVIFGIPYEMLPTPQKGEQVIALNRSGEAIGYGLVTKIIQPKRANKTSLVYVEVAEELIHEFATVKVGVLNE